MTKATLASIAVIVMLTGCTSFYRGTNDTRPLRQAINSGDISIGMPMQNIPAVMPIVESTWTDARGRAFIGSIYRDQDNVIFIKIIDGHLSELICWPLHGPTGTIYMSED